MTRNIVKRLEKLESQVESEISTEKYRNREYRADVLLLAKVFYLGNPKPGEPDSEAYARALGFANSVEMIKTREPDDPHRIKKYARALTQLLAKFGVSGNDISDEVLERMKNGFSEPYRQKLREIDRFWRRSAEFR